MPGGAPGGGANVAKLEQKVESLESEIKSLRSQLNSLNSLSSEIESLKRQLQQQNSQITSMQSTITKLQSQGAGSGASAGAAAAQSRAVASPRVQQAPARPHGKVATVAYDYQGDPSQNTLTVRVGEQLSYEGNPSDDWLMCTKSNGESGYVPNTYLTF